MALYLRGKMWWFEIKNQLVHIRKSTGFTKKHRREAQAVYDAMRIAVATKPNRQVIDNLLSAVYDDADKIERVPINALWTVYEDWARGKNKVVAASTTRRRKTYVERFIGWATRRGIKTAEDMTPPVAREYARHLRSQNVTTKTLRNTLQTIDCVWRAAGQLNKAFADVWKAAIPDDDGTSRRHPAFTPDEEKRVLESARRIGHGWYLASMIARWTALRYGDVARLTWEAIDWEAQTIDVTPAKTKRHGTHLVLPIAAILRDALEEHCPDPSRRIGYILEEHARMFRRGCWKRNPFASVLRDAGIEDTTLYTFHSWRHTCASRLAESGASMEMIRRFGGWTTDEMARHYDQSTRLAEMQSAIDKSGI